MKNSTQTRDLILQHHRTYPLMQIRDLFKFLFQSAFGCEHLVSNEDTAISYIRREYASLARISPTPPDPLDGAYSRVHLSCLQEGLTPETLGKLFCRSAKAEPSGREDLQDKLGAARDLIREGLLPFSPEDFEEKLTAWTEAGYPPVHHSDAFRAAYSPAYRVIANEYIPFLPLLARIDTLPQKEVPTVVAIEGGSASGKTTLARLLEDLYGCTVFHMDDFFLRPEQRTPDRLAEIGGNLDRERFLEEVLRPLGQGKPVCYRPFDCATGALLPPVTVTPEKLTVIEGAYSMHPSLASHYDLSVFLDIDPAYQKKRILERNSPAFAKRFFEEWIPLEQRYFSQTHAPTRCDLTVCIEETSFS